MFAYQKRPPNMVLLHLIALMHVAERQDYHLIDDLWFAYKILKVLNFCWRFSCHHHFRHRPQSGPDFSEINNDADLIFIAV